MDECGGVEWVRQVKYSSRHRVQKKSEASQSEEIDYVSSHEDMRIGNIKHLETVTVHPNEPPTRTAKLK